MNEKISPHEGWMNYHCRKCDTHVSIRPGSDRDITKMCLCARGVITSKEPVSPAFPVKARPAPPAADDVIEKRIAAKRQERKRRGRSEWQEEI